MLTKRFNAPLAFKAADDGSFSAVFSTLGTIDHDGDVTLPGAFADGQEVRIAQWGHNWGDLPVGRGVIHADNEKAWVDGSFFLDTPHGLATYQTVKGLGKLQEWSYGFSITESDYGDFNGRRVRFLRRLDVTEVSPVMRAAGIATGTVLVGGERPKALAVTGAMPGSYEETAQQIGEAIYQAGLAADDEMVVIIGTFADYAVVCICGWDGPGTPRYLRIPYALAAEGVTLGEPQEMEPALVPAMENTYSEQAAKTLAVVRAFHQRSKSLADLRRKEGRVLSSANRDRLAKLPDALRAIIDDLEALLAEASPPEKAADPPDVYGLFLQFEQFRARQHGGLFV